MNSVVHENELPGEKAQKTLPGTVTGTLGGETPVRLEVSWHVAPAQNVAILNSSDEAADNDLPALAPTRPAATAVRVRPQKYKYL